MHTGIVSDQTDGAKPAMGFGPNRGGNFSQEDYHHPAAGWGAAISVSNVLIRQGELIDGTRAVFKMNHENGGYDCPGCAWPDDRKGLRMDICENGIKHATWEMSRKLVERDFFAAHTVKELTEWTDYALEASGRLTEPMRYDAASDKYVPVSWDEAFELAGRHFRSLENPNQAAFYTSGRLSNEATFLYQLFAREFGTNNLPDCSNMCHEASGRALSAAIGTGKGTVDLVDWEKTDCLIILGVNAASNAPRMLTSLAEAYRRGAQIVHVNPFIEAASRNTIVPHEIPSMMLFHPTRIGTLNIQPRIAGDMALMRGVAKHLLEASETDPDAIDWRFVERYTEGFDSYQTLLKNTSWGDIKLQSGVERTQIQALGVAVPDSRPLQCARQSDLWHRSPSGRELAGPPGPGMWHQVAAGAWVGHRSRDSGHDARRGEDFCRNGGQLCSCGAGSCLHLPSGAEMRPHDSGQHKT
jgi:molybdopterin-dependent oxidoreductase alpha subunit